MSTQSNILKRSFGSNVYLVATLMFTLTAVAGFATALMPSMGGTILVASIISLMENFLPKVGFLSAIATGKVLSAIVQYLPSLIIALAMWLAWADASGKSALKGLGFRILYIMEWITLVPVILLFAASAAFGLWNFGSTQVLVAMGTVLLMALTVALIVYLKDVTKAYQSAEYAVSFNRYESQIAEIVVIVPYVIAAARVCLLVLGIFLTPFRIFGFSTPDIVVTAIEACGWICLAMTFAQAKRDSVVNS